jgi:adenylylsulfate kinase-like enzyme
MRRTFSLALLIVILIACHRTNIDRAQWQSMSANEKTLYVRTLLGHEKTKEAKGGNDRAFTGSIDDYVRGIDDAYARGDSRTVDAIFETMGRTR